MPKIKNEVNQSITNSIKNKLHDCHKDPWSHQNWPEHLLIRFHWSQNWLPGTNLGAKIGYSGTNLGAKIGYPKQTWEPKMVTRNKPRSQNWLPRNKTGSQNWLPGTNLGAKICYPEGVRKFNLKCLKGVWTVSWHLDIVWMVSEPCLDLSGMSLEHALNVSGPCLDYD